MGNRFARKSIIDEIDISELVKIREENLKVLVYGDSDWYEKSELFFHKVTTHDSHVEKSNLDAAYRTTKTLQKRSPVEARLGTRVRRLVKGNVITMICAELWLLPTEFKTLNKDKYTKGADIAFSFGSEENIKSSLVAEDNESDALKILNMVDLHETTDPDEFVYIFDDCLIEYLADKNKDEADLVDSDEEDAENDMLHYEPQSTKNWLSRMKETDERLAKIMAAVTDMQSLEETYKEAVFEFLENFKTINNPQQPRLESVDDIPNSVSAEDALQLNKKRGTDVKSVELTQLPSTTDFDNFMRQALAEAQYRINIVDGRGGMRLVPKAKKMVTVMGEEVKIQERDMTDDDRAFENLGEKRKRVIDIFKSYNSGIYASGNDILTVYPESMQVLEQGVAELESQMDTDAIYGKSISHGKTDMKSYEIYQAVKITVENAKECLEHAGKVLEYVKKREQKIQVALLMNQVL